MRLFNWILSHFGLKQFLLGLILSWAYMIYLRHVFESHTNITQLSQFEREALLKREDALHYSFYKKLANARNFWHGYEQLKNITDIEYPKNVNVLKRFFIMPELIAGYLYHVARQHNIPLFSCWPVKSANPSLIYNKYKICDRQSYPLQFYLTFAWFMNGFAIFIVYMNAILLCEITHGGIFGMITYIMYHNYNAKAHERPMAHENFAFPLISLQLYLICRQLKRIFFKGVYTGRIINVISLTVINTAALLFWPFTSMIFLLHVIILGCTLNFYPGYRKILFKFLRDVTAAILISPFFAYYFFFGNNQYYYVWQTSPAFGFLLVSLVRSIKWFRRGYNLNSKKVFGFSTLIMTLLVAYDAHMRSINLLQKGGVIHPIDNTFVHYYNLNRHWRGRSGVQDFVTHLASCNPLYEHLSGSDLMMGWKRMFVNPFFLFVLMHIGLLLKRLRFPKNVPEFKYKDLKIKRHPSRKWYTQDECWRAQMKLLEEMVDVFQIKEDEIGLQVVTEHAKNCVNLLIDCNYDFNVYEEVKAIFMVPDTQDHIEFVNDLVKLQAKECASERNDLCMEEALKQLELQPDLMKEQLNQNSKNQNGDQQQEKSSKKKRTNKKKRKKAKSAEKALMPREQAGEQEQEHVNQYEQPEVQAGGQHHNNVPEFTWPPPTAVWKLLKNLNIPAFATPSQLFLTVHFIIFATIGLYIKKLCFIPYTQLCILMPAVTTRIWYYEYRRLFWITALMISVCAMFDCGWLNRYDFFNLHNETYISCNTRPDAKLNEMLVWIRTSTERDAVFAGSVDIIGTVHLTTGRPIFNHAHLEMPHITTRTEDAYKIYSRHHYHQSYVVLRALKVQYIIVEVKHCKSEPSDACNVLNIWDKLEPKTIKDEQFCAHLLQYDIAAYRKVFRNSEYVVILLSMDTVDIGLGMNRLQEKQM